MQVTETKTRGMTWKYTLNVLAPDGVTIANPAPTFEVNYITEATHRATVTGISVDGKPIPGFDQSKHDYSVAVDNIDHWTASADGLVKTSYTVTVHERLLGGSGEDGQTVDGLAHTGSDASGLLVAEVGLLVAGIACAIAAAVARLRRKPRHDQTDATASDGQEDKPQA